MLLDPKVLLRTLQAYLSVSSSQRESQIALPSISVVLKPLYDYTTNATYAVNVSITLFAVNLIANNSLVELPLLFGTVPSQNYNGSNPLSAVDALGSISLTFEDDPNSKVRRWLPDRAVVGDVNLSCTAFPRHVDINTPIGPRVDLRRQGRSDLMGAGFPMLPLPPALNTIYDIAFSWDLGDSPEDTHVASSLGDGTAVKLRDRLAAVPLSLFAVGTSLRRYPSDVSQSPEFGLYWFEEDTSYNIPELAEYIHDLHSNMSRYFQSEHIAPYRVFLRDSFRGFGGAAFFETFMLEHYPDAPVSIFELRDLLAHEIVHNWPFMEFQVHTISQQDAIWYNEGIATYYQAWLPYHFGLTGRTQLLKRLNDEAQAYYTNPTVHLTNREAANKAWQDPNAQRLPYYRGMMYFTYLDHRIRTASDGVRGLNDLVFDLLNHRRSNEQHGLQAWLALVFAELGQSALDDYYAMANGSLIVPPVECLGYLGFELVRIDQERFELGFDTASFNARKITGVVPGSRAAEAGLCNSDRIVEVGSLHWQVADEIGRNMSLRLRRNGEELDIVYWPRSYEKVQSYRWVDTENLRSSASASAGSSAFAGYVRPPALIPHLVDQA